ncbi:MAG: 3-phosphoshikimate 1-carboxyvinyltransferase [Nitrososphaeria archaeon]|nr:3-phosphoshikimate 1-carboxyvinyltransferase [Nitrososphaeria archaeon]
MQFKSLEKLDRLYVNPSVMCGRIRAPPSKSYTHRAYALSLLVDGRSIIESPLKSGDTQATLRACKQFGAMVFEENESTTIIGSRLNLPEDVVDAENSGTTLRIFTAISTLAPPGYVVLTGDESLRRRPMQPLLDALKHLGVECWSTRGNGCAPIIVKSGGLKGGETIIRGDISSQFISALLIASTKAKEETRIKIESDIVSKKYIDATIEVLKRYGYTVRRDEYQLFIVEPNQSGRSTHFKIPGDFSSASFILAGAYLTNGKVEVENLSLELPQADSAIIDILKDFDNKVYINSSKIVVESSGISSGDREYDLKDSPDLVPVVAVMASKSIGETIIKGVKHARFKESDRITSTAIELRKLGVDVEVYEDGMKIRGKEEIEGGVELDPHNDHRLSMAFSILAASTKRGCIISGLRWAEISYPNFLEDLKRLNISFREV